MSRALNAVEPDLLPTRSGSIITEVKPWISTDRVPAS